MKIFSKSVDSVLASFQRTVDNLKAIAEREDSKADDALVEAAKFDNKAEAHLNEAARARTAADRLSKLLGS